MSIISYFETIVKYIQGNSLKFYLVIANATAVIFSIWFSNSNLLPFAKFSNFAILLAVAFVFALYRPGWAFLLFIGSIVLENINLIPRSFSFGLNPYQFFGFLTIISLGVLYSGKRIKFSLPKWLWADLAILIFAVSGFLSAVFAQQKGLAVKQSLVAVSFVALYFLTRIYIQNFSDVKRVLPIFISSSVVILSYSIWQNLRFSRGSESFEAMPGRPNATFSEPDWLGIYLVFVLATTLSLIYALAKKNDFNLDNLKKDFVFWISSAFLTLIAVGLIITVARSAWLGAIVVSIGFLKVVAYDGFWNFNTWRWREASYAFLGIIFSLILAIGMVKVFKLTTFDLGGRAQSTASGLQEITISCKQKNISVPKSINSVSELAGYGCRHINLEEIRNEEAEGNYVSVVLRPDPTAGVRSAIYQKSIFEIKENPIFGLGWGNIGEILGQDENGNYLNSSNIFLEVWLGGGILGVISFIAVLAYILFKSSWIFIRKPQKRDMAVFVLLGLFAVIIPNLFNAGIFLGFLWVYVAISISLLNNKK